MSEETITWVPVAEQAAQTHMKMEQSSPPTAVGSNAGLGVISRDEWQRRYAARIMERAGWPEHAAMEAGRVGAEEYERSERAAGNAVVWLGVSAGGPWDTPEDLADEEMSYWEDDGEG